MHHFGAKLAVAGDLFRRQLTGLEDVLIVVDIVQKGIQCGDALGEAAGDFLPLLARYYVWHDVKRNQPLGAGGLPIDGKGDSDAVKHQIGGLTVLRNFLRRRPGKPIGKSGVLRTNATVSGVHLIVKRLERHGGVLGEVVKSNNGVQRITTMHRHKATTMPEYTFFSMHDAVTPVCFE